MGKRSWSPHMSFTSYRLTRSGDNSISPKRSVRGSYVFFTAALPKRPLTHMPHMRVAILLHKPDVKQFTHRAGIKRYETVLDLETDHVAK